VQPGSGGVAPAHVVALGEMGLATWTNAAHALGRVSHCIAATIASLASHAPSAAALMAAEPGAGVVATLMLLAKVHDRGRFTHSGHVRASAACALSFLACHDATATGDACLVGPYRPALLAAGALVRASTRQAVLQTNMTSSPLQHAKRITALRRRANAAVC
jgi:hypothetical protein